MDHSEAPNQAEPLAQQDQPPPPPPGAEERVAGRRPSLPADQLQGLLARIDPNNEVQRTMLDVIMGMMSQLNNLESLADRPPSNRYMRADGTELRQQIKTSSQVLQEIGDLTTTDKTQTDKVHISAVATVQKAIESLKFPKLTDVEENMRYCLGMEEIKSFYVVPERYVLRSAARLVPEAQQRTFLYSLLTHEETIATVRSEVLHRLNAGLEHHIDQIKGLRAQTTNTVAQWVNLFLTHYDRIQRRFGDEALIDPVTGKELPFFTWLHNGAASPTQKDAIANWTRVYRSFSSFRAWVEQSGYLDSLWSLESKGKKATDNSEKKGSITGEKCKYCNRTNPNHSPARCWKNPGNVGGMLKAKQASIISALSANTKGPKGGCFLCSGEHLLKNCPMLQSTNIPRAIKDKLTAVRGNEATAMTEEDRNMGN